jgi:hypothetical protein
MSSGARVSSAASKPSWRRDGVPVMVVVIAPY